MLGERTHESGSDPCNARLKTMCSLNFCSPRCGTYHFCHSQRGAAVAVALVEGKQGWMVSPPPPQVSLSLSFPSLSSTLHPFSEWQEGVGGSAGVVLGQQGTSLMKSQHMEMDEEWAERAGVGVRGQKGGNWLRLASRHERGCKRRRRRRRGEAKDEREGRREGDEDRRRGIQEWGGGVTLKGGMPESNGLIQGLSSMESRACQIACNQQPSPLSVGGMVHGEGKQRINTEWSFCSGDVVPFFFSFYI